MTDPLLVLVSGPPGAGKTVLVRELAPRLALPLVAKDVIKEALADSVGRTGLRWSRRLGAMSWDVMFALVDRFIADGASVIWEANFYPNRRPDRRPGRQRDRIAQLRCRPFELHCTADPEVLRRRVRSRERHPVHHEIGDPARWAKDNGPLELDGNVLRLDTSAGEPFDLDHIVERIRGI